MGTEWHLTGNTLGGVLLEIAVGDEDIRLLEF